jgi:uncharacterized protein (TIGR02246 family)
MTRRFAIVLLLAACGGLGLARHYQSGKTEERAAGGEDRAADRAAIATTFQQLLKALGKGDADAVASFWTDTGEYIDDEGEIIRGRKALAAAYKKFFAKTRGLQVQGKASDLRFLGQDAAVAEGVFDRQGAKELPATSARFTALLVREKGKWRLAQLREEERGEPASLDDVKWLIGDWVAKTPDREVSVRYAWDPKKVFMRGRFAVREKGKEVLSGEQIIGRDASADTLRSWVFDSEGGFGSGVWERDGKQWVVDSEGVQADGTTTSSVNVLTPVDADTFTWQSRDRSAGTDAKPDTVPVKVTRVKKNK